MGNIEAFSVLRVRSINGRRLKTGIEHSEMVTGVAIAKYWGRNLSPCNLSDINPT